jgi:hypothetical protein
MMLGRDYAKLRRELADQFEDRGPREWFYEAVLDALPVRVRPRFEALEPREKVERFLTWMRQHTACRGEVTQAELEQFFAEELDAEKRAQLLTLPPGEMEQALRRLYRCQPKTGADGGWSWGPRDGDRQFGPPGAMFGNPRGREFGAPPGPGGFGPPERGGAGVGFGFGPPWPQGPPHGERFDEGPRPHGRPDGRPPRDRDGDRGRDEGDRDGD